MDIFKIYLVEDHKMLREAIKSLLEEDQSIKIVGENENGLQALKEIKEIDTDMVITDLSLPGLTGNQLIQSLKTGGYKGKILIITRHDSINKIMECLDYGADGYILKEDTGASIKYAVEQIKSGKQYFSEQIQKELDLIKNNQKNIKHTTRVHSNDFNILTDKEKQVSKLIAEGHRTKDIAKLLGVEVTTIKTHRRNIFMKLNINSAAELVNYIIRLESE